MNPKNDTFALACMTALTITPDQFQTATMVEIARQAGLSVS